MSAPISKQDINAVEDKVCSTKGDTSSSAQVVELCSLSGDKPFFDVILSNSHVNIPYCLMMPSHMRRILPRVNVSTVVTHGDKAWNLSYLGKYQNPRFDRSGWKKFVADNNLKCEDACIFEVLESTNEILRLKVIILRDTAALPPQLQARGETQETAIELLD